MSNDRSRKALMEFMDYLADKGLMAKNTAMARKAASNKVLGILPEDMTSDVTTIDLDEVMLRFQNLEGKKYTPGSLNTYKSRVRAALDDFESYLKNPMGFRPNLQTRERRSKNTTAESSGTMTDAGGARNVQPSRPVTSSPASSTILPIPIRPDLTVHIQGLPFDLTEAEARKISNVVLAMAVSGN